MKDRLIPVIGAALVAAIFAVGFATMPAAATAEPPQATAPATYPSLIPGETCVELEPGLWYHTGPVPVPCGPTAGLQPVHEVDPVTGCTPAVPSTSCPWDQPAVVGVAAEQVEQVTDSSISADTSPQQPPPDYGDQLVIDTPTTRAVRLSNFIRPI